MQTQAHYMHNCSIADCMQTHIESSVLINRDFLLINIMLFYMYSPPPPIQPAGPSQQQQQQDFSDRDNKK